MRRLVLLPLLNELFSFIPPVSRLFLSTSVHRSFGHFAKTNMAACLGSSVIPWDWLSPDRLSRGRACHVSHQAGTNGVDITIPRGGTAAPDWQPSSCSSSVRSIEPTRLVSPRLLPSCHTALKIASVPEAPCHGVSSSHLHMAVNMIHDMVWWCRTFFEAIHDVSCVKNVRLCKLLDLHCHYLCLIKLGAGLIFSCCLDKWI